VPAHYLLFNGGGISASPDAVLRKDRVLEAMPGLFLAEVEEGRWKGGKRGRETGGPMREGVVAEGEVVVVGVSSGGMCTR